MDVDVDAGAVPATEAVQPATALQDSIEQRMTALIVPSTRSAPVTDDDALLPALGEPEDERVDLAFRRGVSGFGFSVRSAQLSETLDHLAHGSALTIYHLDYERAAALDAGVAPSNVLAWQTLAHSAAACRFDLCQFEFGSSGRGGAAAQIRRWRIPLAVVAASVAVALVTVNVQWLRLRHQRDGLTEAMTQLAQQALPPGVVMLDPHAQIASQLARMRSAAGELRADDFLTLAAGLTHALGPVPADALTSLNYNSGALEVSFKPGAKMDQDAFAKRLASQGIAAHQEEGKWTLKPSPSGTR